MAQGHRAECASCGKAYRVPAPDKTYTCKACGGKVHGRPPASPAAAPSADEVVCPACSAIHPPGTRFCSECGVDLEESGSREAPPEPAGREEKRRAAADLRKARRSIKVARAVYLGGAILEATVVLLTLATLRTGSGEPSAELLVGLAVSATLTAAFVAGAILVPFYPFALTVAVACLLTINFFARGFPVLPGLLMVAAWSLVVPTVRARELIERHADLYISHLIHGTASRRPLRGSRAKGDSRTLQDQARRSAWIRAGVAALVIGVATAGGAMTTTRGGGLGSSEPAPAIDARAEHFLRAWNESSPDDLAALFRPESREKMRSSLRNLAQGQGWAQYPRISGWDSIALARERVEVWYEVEGVEFKTTWSLSDGGVWELTSIRPPR